MLIWIFGMAVVLAVSVALFDRERDRFGQNILFEGITREIVAAVDVLDHLTPGQRAEWIETLGRRRLRFMLSPPPPDWRAMPHAFPLTAALRRALPDRDVKTMARMTTGGNFPRHRQALVSMRLGDGSPLSVSLPAPLLGGRPPPAPGSLLAALASLVLGVTLLTWIAVRIATRPLSRLAAAADALGANPNGAPMDPSGPTEVARAAQAFNQMQQRIQVHVGERTRILAAISHDLQTPITRLRLRAELVEDEALRTKIQSDLDAMQALAKEGLDYARSLDANTAAQAIDLNALASALCGDAVDMGWAMSLAGQTTTPCEARPDALRRALWNLIENGVKFGERVEITLDELPDRAEVRVRDHGPGLSAEEIGKVFEPFYRTEASRNRDTGGTGLGLAIARNLVHAQGGDIRLTNAPDGGLVATVTLPKARTR
jgi:protein-histidine pros-kinase